ncbi:recombinase family protein, partial [Nonomuraea dietziae]|uniref:recombinase family protein n=1 Tax=Nonomuraea dietziae TaxID=65515 RepID=UPI0033E2537D
LHSRHGTRSTGPGLTTRANRQIDHDPIRALASRPQPARRGAHRQDPTPDGRLVFHIFAALAEFIRELIAAGTHEGLAAAKARGRAGGRPTVVNAELLKAARDLLPDPGRSVTSIAKLLGVSVGTLYNHIPDLQELRSGQQSSLK